MSKDFRGARKGVNNLTVVVTIQQYLTAVEPMNFRSEV